MQFVTLTEDADGVSSYSEIPIQMTEQQFAPPAPPMLLSDGETASRLLFLTLPAGWVGEMHPSPRKQVAILLRGRFSVQAGDGEIREMGPGEIFRMEDTTGLGHRSAAVGPDSVDMAIVQF